MKNSDLREENEQLREHLEICRDANTYQKKEKYKLKRKLFNAINILEKLRYGLNVRSSEFEEGEYDFSLPGVLASTDSDGDFPETYSDREKRIAEGVLELMEFLEDQDNE